MEDALRELTQDLTTFNLEQYAKLKGRYTLDDLKLFTQKAIIALRGSFVPSGEIIRIVTPDILLDYPRVSARYDNVTFSRQTATRRKGIELLGLGHPLIDALLAHYKSDRVDGEVLLLDDFDKAFLCLRYIWEIDFTDGMRRTLYKEIPLHGTCTAYDLELLKGHNTETMQHTNLSLETDRLESIVENTRASIRSEYDGIVNIRHKCVGIASANAGL